ncbi:MAG: serine/threonine-protein kinase [Myxococcaceae bacterium]
MSSTVRRVAGAAVAVALFAVAFAVSSRQRAQLEQEALDQAQQLAGQTVEKSRAGIDKLGAHLLDTAKTGAGLRSLEALVTSSVDEQTFQDFFATEEAWAPYRKFDASALFIGEKVIASTGDTDLMADAVKVADDARAAGTAMAWVAAKGKPARLAAVRMRPQTPNGGVAVVVVLAEWLTEAALQQAADPAAGVAVAAGGAPLKAGSAEQQAAVERALSASPPSELRTARDQLGKGVSLVAVIDSAPMLQKAAADARRTSVVLFVLATVLGGVLVALLWWPRKDSSETSELLRETTLQLKRSQEELQKVSLRLSQPGLQAFTPGDTVSMNAGRYRTLAPLGEGGMAKVSVAALEGQQGFRRLFVLKRLKAELMSPEARAQFTDEALLGARLVHSNIVPVLDFGQDAEGYFIAQEYILGRNLDAISQVAVKVMGKPLPVEVVLYVAQETLRALEYAHHLKDEAGRPLNLVHRDVSPNNLMVSERGEVKLLDFGIVKSEQRLTQTTPGVVKGNLFFMSPEQARGQNVDARSDVFSLGMVLYVLAAGLTLYGGETSYEVLTRAAHGLVGEDLQLVRSLGSPLAPLIERAMKYEPSERFQSASEFLTAVQATGRLGNAQQLEKLMRHLFSHELAAETARLRGHPST